MTRHMAMAYYANRIGKFMLHVSSLANASDQMHALVFGNMFICKATFFEETSIMEYVAFSHLFDSVELDFTVGIANVLDSDVIPYYVLRFHSGPRLVASRGQGVSLY